MGSSTCAPEDNLANCNMALNCVACQHISEEPCLLPCLHSVCAKCARRGSEINGALCSICQESIAGKELMMPPEYGLILNILDENVDEAKCSNCDKDEKSTMFYCSTCGQVLCGYCKEEVHTAKMFSEHKLINIGNFKANTQCTCHREEITMVSSKTKEPFCGKCYATLSHEKRRYCVSIDIAYQQDRAYDGMNALQVVMKSIKQKESEVNAMFEEETRGTLNFFNLLLERVKSLSQSRTCEIQRKHREQSVFFGDWKKDIENVLSSGSSCIILSTLFIQKASKHDFLCLVPHLEKRMKSLLQKQLQISYKKLEHVPHSLESNAKVVEPFPELVQLLPEMVPCYKTSMNGFFDRYLNVMRNQTWTLEKKYERLKNAVHNDCGGSYVNNVRDLSSSIINDLENVKRTIEGQKTTVFSMWTEDENRLKNQKQTSSNENVKEMKEKRTRDKNPENDTVKGNCDKLKCVNGSQIPKKQGFNISTTAKLSISQTLTRAQSAPEMNSQNYVGYYQSSSSLESVDFYNQLKWEQPSRLTRHQGHLVPIIGSRWRDKQVTRTRSDSFEGHEEAVKHLVRAVRETREKEFALKK
eukprot:maker-scaffold775_size99154-snap-gene-0.18 protein:Tk07857 transcript:maker-scaffold775_size99154-snap-gene-0.18-mRNA-1 annotation:"ring finger protein"